MQFYSERELSAYPQIIWQKLSETGELIITDNGKPRAIMIDVNGINLEDILSAIRQLAARKSINQIRLTSLKNGNYKMTETEIETEIKAAREDI
jgi:hypothetical protein